MKIVADSITRDELKKMAAGLFGDMVKAAVDVERGLVALDAELHADLETALIQNGSLRKNIWGINLYPDAEKDDFIEYDSMINMRPGQGNKSRGIEDEALRKNIIAVVAARVRT